MKKLLSILLCVALLLPAAGLAEPVPIKWKGTITVASYMFAPLTRKDVVVGKVEILKNKYGYDVDIQPVYIEYPQYQEVINTRIAGKTAPDIFISMSETNMRTLYDQGAIASWDVEFFKEHAPDMYNFFNNGAYKGRMKSSTDMFWYFSTRLTAR